MKKHILVAGGSKGYGLATASHLISRGHKVHCCQRAIPPGHGCIDMGEDYYDPQMGGFRSLDFSNESNALASVAYYKSRDIQFDIIVHSVAQRQSEDPELLTAIGISNQVNVNLISPLMWTIYMDQYGVLAPGAKILWYVDTINKDPELLGYQAANKTTPSFCELFKDSISGSMHYLLLPALDGPLSDGIPKKVENIISQTYPSRVIDLRHETPYTNYPT